MIFKYLTDILFKLTHTGQLVQVGLNMGPRHARVLGWAKSYTKKLDSQAMVEHDLDAVGTLSIMWSMVQSTMPNEILGAVNSCLAEVGLPHLATRNVDEGFFSIFVFYVYAELF
jgi:hypothetical protein